ncbi:DUF1816 domain-containing protein [Nodularia sp. NIES-3585]|uniref:DUF1816 domain-containing protein n=1 Tax=Nodularia sp. NIES-3585 TaxID=1973477 RepID=UPI000B5CD11C|nr:DUF1816 domain-containing protein [Nodularia sp. NIES-3585]
MLGFMPRLRMNWWVEIITTEPLCTYYFGPFANFAEAEFAHSGYIEDLEFEGAQGIKFTIKRCQPKVLTIFDLESESFEAEYSHLKKTIPS